MSARSANGRGVRAADLVRAERAPPIRLVQRRWSPEFGFAAARRAKVQRPGGGECNHAPAISGAAHAGRVELREKVMPVPADTRRALGLAALLAGAGATHFAVPKFYDAMIPEALPGTPRRWTYGSALIEITTAAAVAAPRTRRLGGLAAATLFAAVLPGNVKMAIDARNSDSAAYRLGTILRLPLQAPLITWALKVRRTAPRGTSH